MTISLDAARIASLVLACIAVAGAQAACLDPKDPTLTRYYHPSLEQETKGAFAIVIGTVSSVQGLSEDSTDPDGWTSLIYTVQITESLKGHMPGPVVLKVENDSSTYRMEQGETHLLFLTKTGSEVSVDSCGNSAQLPAGNPVVERVRSLLASGSTMRSNQPLHPTTSGGLTAAVVAGERRR